MRHTVCQLATVGIAYALSVINGRKQEGLEMYKQICDAVESVQGVVWGWGMIVLLLAGTVPGVPGGRRAAGGHPQEPADAQGDPGS